MKKSLGTISALAALCASSQTSGGAVMTSTTIDNSIVVSNTGDNSLPISLAFDFNGDAVDDFVISSPANDSILYITLLGRSQIVVDSATSAVKSLQIGDVIDPANQSYLAGGPHILHSPLNAATSIIKEGSVYFGIHFAGGSGYEEGWVRLDTTLNGGSYDESGDSIIAATSQWESTPNGSITIVPEPSSSLLAMAGLASLTFLRRRQD